MIMHWPRSDATTRFLYEPARPTFRGELVAGAANLVIGAAGALLVFGGYVGIVYLAEWLDDRDARRRKAKR